MRHEFENGKYTYIFDNGEQYALRNGEPWRDLTGDKFIYCMAAELETLQAKYDELLEASKKVLAHKKQRRGFPSVCSRN